MTTIAEKIIEIQKSIEDIPVNLIWSRLSIIESIILAEEMRDTFAGSLTAQVDGTKGLNYICEELSKIRTTLKGGNYATDILNYEFNDPSFYTNNATFTFPSTTVFGFYVLDNDGNELTDSFISSPGSYYLSTDATTNEMIAIDDDSGPYLTPTEISNVTETIIGVFNPDNSTITGALTNQPVYKTSPIPTVTISVESTEIGTVDELGVITSTPAGGYDLDAVNSVMNYSTKELTCVFLSKLSTSNQAINVNYDYSTTTPTGDVTMTYDAGTGTFSGTLVQNWGTETLGIYVNGTKKVGISVNKAFMSMEIVPLGSYISDNLIVVKFKDTKITSDVVIKYDIVTISGVNEQIALVQQTAITDYNLDATRVSPNTNPIIKENSRILFSYVDGNGDVQIDEVGVMDSSGNVTGISPYGVTGLLDEPSPGLYQLDLTFTVFPAQNVTLLIEYDYVDGYTTWLNSFTPLDMGAPTSLSVNGDGLNLITLNSALGAPPVMMKTYPLKKWFNHQLWANLIVVCEGLELNTDWVPYRIDGSGTIATDTITYADVDITYGLGFMTKTLDGKTLNITGGNSYTILSNDSGAKTITMTASFSESGTQSFTIDGDAPGTATKIGDTAFGDLMGWLDPDAAGIKDVLISANPNNVSNSISPYTDIEKNPFFPSTDGTHADKNVILGKTGDDLFAGNHDHAEDTNADSNDELKWWVHSDEKWQYDTDPGNVAEQITAFLTSFAETFSTDMNDFDAYSPPNTATIPPDDTVAASPVQEVWYELNTNVTPNKIHYIYNESDTGEFSCYFNDLQDYLYNGRASRITTQISKLAALQALNVQGVGPNGYRDPNYSSTDQTFHQAFDDYESATDNVATFETYHNTWTDTSGGVFTVAGHTTGFFRRAGTDPGPTVYTATKFTLAGTTLGTFRTASNTEKDHITNRMGTAVAVGSVDSYSKQLYDAVNYMVNKDIKYVSDVLSAFYKLDSFYTQVTDNRAKRDKYLGV